MVDGSGGSAAPCAVFFAGGLVMGAWRGEQAFLRQHPANRSGVFRVAIEIALTLELAELDKRLEHVGVLDALGSDRPGLARTDLGNGLDDRCAFLARAARRDEAAVDLDAVERQRPQLGEAGIA